MSCQFYDEAIRTAVIIHKTTSDFIPDFHVRRITKWRWITFPWHVWEHLTAFIKEIRTYGFQSVEDIRRELKDRYNIEVRLELINEILSEMKM